MSQIKDTLEHRQTGIYFLTMVAAAVVAACWPAVSGVVVVLNPALASMLFVTFLSLPLGEMLNAFRYVRFLLALFIANFVAIPALVALLLALFPLAPMVAYGVAMVLLCPCIDYVVTFCQQGQADSRLLLAATPLLLLLQMLLLPLYLGLLFDTAQTISIAPFLQAFITMIATPLLLAWIFQRWSKTSAAGRVMANWLGCFPVPATALVLAVITAFVVPQLTQSRGTALAVLPVYLLFSALAPLAGWGVARLLKLNAAEGRGVVFSAATRNSLVILPLALAVPGALPLMPVVVVSQTLVELIAELIYVHWVPRLRFHAGK
ncbi:arsenic resistance protein [Lonsdalea populi]|uniref:Arsenic resistance protein n=1 Tax=Lonsdalea populi TaxID=1172565 RepID=A0A3N0UB93_9GAMM|nr:MULTISPECIES: arsenic resistance protein [Lonsdalea]RAT14841.1 arsenic resistance protein [Lonsdalea quercina]RAT28170.1 arsenic resistance protein [Lonsdalea populi]RAT37304.1 arsenic resistance protein [Lonsdalea populi]RAT45501.1 arsenic resistance protein [Lonsdalea populi]RAT50919.1 arsenic resistance protein [Lonsdalea populi]